MARVLRPAGERRLASLNLIATSNSFVPTNVQSQYPSRIFKTTKQVSPPLRQSKLPIFLEVCRVRSALATIATRCGDRRAREWPAASDAVTARCATLHCKFDAAVGPATTLPAARPARARLRRRHPRPNMSKISSCEDATAALWPRAHRGVSLFRAFFYSRKCKSI